MSQRPRVLVLRRPILPYSETFTYDQCAGLTRWEPTLMGLFEQKNGADTAPIRTRIIRFAPNKRINNAIVKICSALGLPLPGLTKAMRAEKPDLVHIHFATDAVFFWPNVKALNLPVLVTLHGFDIHTNRDYWESGGNGFENKHYPERLLKLAREPNVRFIAVSQSIREAAITFGLPADKITVSYIGVDLEKFSPGSMPFSARPKRLLYTGRLHEKKGIGVLLEAFARLQKTHPDAELVLLGGGDIPAHQALAKTFGVKADFKGSVDHATVRDYVNTSRALCLPSVTAKSGDAEGFGMTILEAQAGGLPVLSSAKGGAEEGILHGQTGLAFAEHDVDALHAHLETLFADDAPLQDMSTKARHFMEERFDRRQWIAALEDLYDQAAGRNQ